MRLPLRTQLLLNRLGARRSLLLGDASVALVFLLARLAARAAGVRFDASPLPWFWQYVEPSLLESDLARSLFYLHAQPPAFNLFLGVVLKLAPDSSTPVFAWTYALLGLGLTLCLHRLLLRLGVSRIGAVAATVLFVASPAALLYENWLFYTFPLAVALVAAALLLHRFLSRRRTADGILFFVVIALIALTRSLFHLGWVAAICLATMAFVPAPDRRRTALLAAIPLALVGGLYVKNALVFDRFSASSWAGMSFAKLALDRTPQTLREESVRAGTISPLALVPPFSPLDAYPAAYTEVATPPVPVLERRTKAGGVKNANHFAYLAISDRYRRDAIAFARERPDLYLRNVGHAFAIYAQPASSYWFLRANRDRIGSYEELYNTWALGGVGRWLDFDAPPRVFGFPFLRRDAAYGWMIVFAVATVAGFWRGGVPLRRRGGASAYTGTLLFLAANVLYVTLVANLLEIGENNRIRFLVDPLALVLAVTLIKDWRVGSREKRRILHQMGRFSADP